MQNEGGIDDIYNPKMKCTPKNKQIFKLEKLPRSTSCHSNDNQINSVPQQKYIGDTFINPFYNFGAANEH